MDDSVGVGDVIRLFFENGHAHYLVTSVNFENEIMVRGKDGVEELLPVQKGVLAAFDGRAVAGLQIIRPPAAEYPKGSEVALDLTSGKHLRGTVQANEDGVLEIALPDQPAPIFVDSRAPHPLVARLAPYAEKEKEAVADLAKTAKTPLESFKALRAEYTNAAGVRAPPFCGTKGRRAWKGSAANSSKNWASDTPLERADESPPTRSAT